MGAGALGANPVAVISGWWLVSAALVPLQRSVAAVVVRYAACVPEGVPRSGKLTSVFINSTLAVVRRQCESYV